MFNSVQWEADLKGMKDEIEASSDKRWVHTVNLRYGFFMLDQAQRQIEMIKRHATVNSIDDFPKQARDHYANEAMQVCSVMHAASALIRGAVIVPDPLTIEATMRLAMRTAVPRTHETLHDNLGAPDQSKGP